MSVPNDGIFDLEKNMHRLFSIVLLVAGVILLIAGINAADSIGSSFSRLFTGEPTDRAIWLLLGGFVGVVLGLASLMRTSSRAH